MSPIYLAGICAQSLQSCLTICDPWTAAHQAPLSMGFSRQEHWSGLPCPSPGTLSDPGIEPVSPASPGIADEFFTTEPLEKPSYLTGHLIPKHLIFLMSYE